MMAAVQPFLSGAISKTCNVPSEATVADIRDAYLEGWRLGLKALAIYRDGSKGSQPVNTKSDADSTSTESAAPLPAAPSPIAAAPAPAPAPVPPIATPAVQPRRERLPHTRRSLTHKFDIQGHEGYVNVGFYPDGRPGELFITMAKEGSTIGGLMDVLGTSISIGLQYGVPLDEFVDAVVFTRFEPAGPVTGNDTVKSATSILDYIFRELGISYLGRKDLATSDPGELNADGMGRGKAEAVDGGASLDDGPQPASRFISRGFSRGAAPDNLVFLPTANRQTGPSSLEAADVCAACGDVAVVRKGAALICQTCGARAGRFGEDLGA
jgi:hypothetical protein